MMNTCLNCKKPLIGRRDKKFCTPYCKSDFHFKRNKDKLPTFFKQIHTQLKLNRKLLKYYNKSGKATIRSDDLLKSGFNPRVFTHYWKTQSGNVYLFCYEYGYWKKVENGKTKYVLIKWQDKYMSLPGLI